MKKLSLMMTFFFLLPLLVFGQLKDRERAELSEINVLVNPGFELGLVRWSSTGTAPTLTTTASEVGLGKASASWDASATGHTFSTQQYTMPNILEGGICEGSIRYNGGDANIDLKVVDGSSVVLGQVTLVAVTSWTKASVLFTCPDSGTVGFTLESTADSAEIFVDQAVLGKSSDLVDFVSTTAWEDFTVSDATFTGDGSTTVSNCTAQSSRYRVLGGNTVEWVGNAICDIGVADTSSIWIESAQAPIAISDQGPTEWPNAAQCRLTGASNSERACVASVVTTTSPVRIEIEVGEGVDWTVGNDRRFRWHVFYEIDPSNAPASVNPIQKVETSAWWAQAFMDDSTSLNTSDDGGVWFPESGVAEDLTSSKAKGTTIYRACEDVDPTLVDCSGGNGYLGVAVDVPKAGAVKVCFQSGFSVNGDDAEQFFRISRYANGSSTVLESGQNQVRYRSDSNSASDREGSYVSVCEIFDVPSGLNSFVLEEQTEINAGTLGGISIRDSSFVVYPIDQQLPQAIVVNEPVFIGARATISADESLANNSSTYWNWDTQLVDTHGFFTPGEDNMEIPSGFCDANGCIVTVVCHLVFQASTNYEFVRSILIVPNGGSNNVFEDTRQAGISGGSSVASATSTAHAVVVQNGDTIQCGGRQRNGSSAARNVDASEGVYFSLEVLER